MPRKLCLASIAVVIAIAAAGCGSSSSTSGKAKLVAEADPICKGISLARANANAELSKAGTSTTKTLAVLARVAPPVAADEHQVVVRLRALKAPASLSAEWQTLLTGIEQLADDTTRIAERAKANDYKGIVSITASARTIRQKLTEIDTRDGFTYCGRTS